MASALPFYLRGVDKADEQECCKRAHDSVTIKLENAQYQRTRCTIATCLAKATLVS
jgi:hypothetical protein